MSEHLTREDLVVATTKAALGAAPHIPASTHEYSLIVEAALAVIVKAITAQVRVLHNAIPAPTSEHYHCDPQECDRSGEGLLQPWCDECTQWAPCPTVRLCDEIDTEMGVQR